MVPDIEPPDALLLDDRTVQDQKPCSEHLEPDGRFDAKSCRTKDQPPDLQLVVLPLELPTHVRIIRQSELRAVRTQERLRPHEWHEEHVRLRRLGHSDGGGSAVWTQ